MNKPTIYIIGAGISGLSGALMFAQAGCNVNIFESTKLAGGRLRSFYDESLNTTIDNGNHLLLGANTNALNLIKTINADSNFTKFEGGNFTFYNTESKSNYSSDGLNLKKIEGFNSSDYLSLLSLLFPADKTIAEVFNPQSGLFKNFIENISRSILNTNPYKAQAKLFRNVLIKILTSKNGLDYYIPKTNWQNGLINPLISKLKELNVNIEYNKSLKRIHLEDNKAQELIFANNSIILQPDDYVILATPSWVTQNIIEDIKTPNIYNPILNIHFKYNHNLSPQIFALLNSAVDWCFVKPDIISTTTSDAGEHLLNMNETELANLVWSDICGYLKIENTPTPPFRIIREKRATHSAEIDNFKNLPTAKTSFKNLFLCGDYVKPSLFSAIMPATIEAAIASAIRVFKIIKYRNKF